MPKRTLTDAERDLLELHLPPYCERTKLYEIVSGARPGDPAHERVGRNVRNALSGERTDADLLDDVRRAGELLLEEVEADVRTLLAYYSARVSETLTEIAQLGESRSTALATLQEEIEGTPALPVPYNPFGQMKAYSEAPPDLIPLSETPKLHLRRSGPRPGSMPQRVQEARRGAVERATARFDAGEEAGNGRTVEG